MHRAVDHKVGATFPVIGLVHPYALNDRAVQLDLAGILQQNLIKASRAVEHQVWTFPQRNIDRRICAIDDVVGCEIRIHIVDVFNCQWHAATCLWI